MSLPVSVVFCFDKTYASYAAVASFSVHKHTQHPLRIFWLVPASDVPTLDTVLSHLADVGIYPEVVPVDAAPFMHWKQSGHNRTVTYTRLLIPELISESKVVYLDCDTLVIGDVAELFAIDMHGSLIGGVLDNGASSKHFKTLSPSDTYINSGVLLMNLDGLRQDGFLLKCGVIHDQYRDTMPFMDQCIINMYAEQRKCFLDAKWNFQVLSNQVRYADYLAKFEQSSPSIIHYIGPVKPWQGWCNPPIARLWQKWSKLAQIPNLSVVPVTQVDQAIELASAMDMNGDFQQASQLKTQIIRSLQSVAR